MFSIISFYIIIKHVFSNYVENYENGETEYNAKGLTQGQLDIPLNENGINQAKMLCEKLKNEKIDIIYASPLARAKQTAEIINSAHNVEIVLDDRLMEFYAGVRQGQDFYSWSQDRIDAFRAHPEDFGAESNIDFFTRVVEFFSEIEDSDKNILIVSHGGVGCILMSYFNGIPVDGNYLSFEIPNGQPLTLNFEKMKEQ